MLRTAEEKERANKLVQKNPNRFEINKRIDGTFFYYLPAGRLGSMDMHENGLKISVWIETGNGTEPDERG